MISNQKTKPELWLQIICILLGIAGLVAYAASKFTSGKSAVIITGVGILGFVAALAILAIRLKKGWPIVKIVGISLLSVIVGTYLILAIFVYFFQDAVANQTSSFFQPKTISTQAAQALLNSNVTAVDLETPDETHLCGWLVKNSSRGKSPLIIYFGGSGSESSELIPLAKKLNGWSVALINYRGFGQSQGTSTQSTVLADALLIYDALSTRQEIDSSRIVAMGYSLGTGVAVYLSEQRLTAGTILVSPYDHWSLIGVKQSPLFQPLAGIMKPYFNSISRAPSITTRLLCLAGSVDTFVPPALSARLCNAWGGEKEVITYPGEDHSLLFHNNSSWTDIANFLNGLN